MRGSELEGWPDTRGIGANSLDPARGNGWASATGVRSNVKTAMCSEAKVAEGTTASPNPGDLRDSYGRCTPDAPKRVAKPERFAEPCLPAFTNPLLPCVSKQSTHAFAWVCTTSMFMSY